MIYLLQFSKNCTGVRRVPGGTLGEWLVGAIAFTENFSMNKKRSFYKFCTNTY